MCGVGPSYQLPATVTGPRKHHFSETQLETEPVPELEPSICKIKQLMPKKILCQID